MFLFSRTTPIPTWMYAALIAVLIFGNVFVYAWVQTPAQLEVSFLNVGDGSAVVIRVPHGATLLVNSGPDASVLRELGAVLPFWQRSIDAVIQTDAAASAASGLRDVLARYRVAQVLMVPSVATNMNIPHTIAHRGQRLDLGAGAYADVLYADEGSLVVRVAYGDAAFLFSGTLSPSVRTYMETLYATTNQLHADVVAIAHQGAKDAVDDAWLAALHPNAAVISVDRQNRYGYPATSTLETLQKASVETFRTDREGRVVFTSDGVTISKK